MGDKDGALSVITLDEFQFSTVGVGGTVRFDFPLLLFHALSVELDNFVHFIVGRSKAENKQLLIETGSADFNVVRNRQIFWATGRNTFAASADQAEQAEQKIGSKTGGSYWIHRMQKWL